MYTRMLNGQGHLRGFRFRFENVFFRNHRREDTENIRSFPNAQNHDLIQTLSCTHTKRAQDT